MTSCNKSKSSRCGLAKLSGHAASLRARSSRASRTWATMSIACYRRMSGCITSESFFLELVPVLKTAGLLVPSAQAAVLVV